MPLNKQAHWHETHSTFADATLDLSLGLHKRIAAELSVPLRSVYQSTQFLDAGGVVLPDFASIHHQNGLTLGLGDLALMGRVRLLRADANLPLRVDLRAGLTVPTGGIEPNPDELARQGLSHRHVFFGSGTLDPQLGVDGTYDFGAWRLMAYVFGHASLYTNRYGYKQGARVSAAVSADFSAGLKEWRFSVGPETYHEEISAWGADVAENSGRTDLLATASATWFPTPMWFLQVRAKIPLYTWAADPITPPWFGMFSVGRQFRLFENAEASK